MGLFKTVASAKQIAKYGAEVVNKLCVKCKFKATERQRRFNGNTKKGTLKFNDYCVDCQEMQRLVWVEHFDK